MVSSFFKWLLLLFIGILSISATPSHYHPVHISVLEINHNATDKTLEISCKIFTDDFEKILRQNYNTKVDLINPPDKSAMDSLINKYLASHLSFMVNGKKISFSYLGFERDNEAVFSYVQSDNLAAVKTIEINCNLMYDLFTDQVNIFHVVVGGKRKSTKLDYPQTSVVVDF